MTHPDAIERPSAVDALDIWKQVRDAVWTINREWRPRPRREHPIETVVLDSLSLRNFFCSLPTLL